MHVVSVNVSEPVTVEHQGRSITTGIFKRTVEGRVVLRRQNLDGDGQADLVHHGGPYRAVYLYPHEHYATWAAEEGRDDFVPGQFGENLTVTGLLERDVRIGDVLVVGGSILQVTQPRTPCAKLGLRMGDPGFVRRFLHAQRPGFYARVLEEGTIGAGDPITRGARDPNAVTVTDLNRWRHFDFEAGGARRALRIDALSPDWAEWLRRRLERDD